MGAGLIGRKKFKSWEKVKEGKLPFFSKALRMNELERSKNFVFIVVLLLTQSFTS